VDCNRAAERGLIEQQIAANWKLSWPQMTVPVGFGLSDLGVGSFRVSRPATASHTMRRDGGAMLARFEPVNGLRATRFPTPTCMFRGKSS
jgi:hypothetical protein